MNKFILGMVLTSFLAQSASAINLSQINDQLKKDLPSSNPESRLKDTGIVVAEGISVIGLARYFPRIDSKTLSAKVAELQTLRAEKTTEDVINEINALRNNTANYVFIEGTALNENTHLGPLTRRARIEVSSLNEELKTINAQITSLNQSTNVLENSISILEEEIFQIRSTVNSYATLVIDANSNGTLEPAEVRAAKLKPNVEEAVTTKTATLQNLQLQLDAQTEDLLSKKAKAQTMQNRINTILSDISLRTRNVLKEDVEIKIKQLQELSSLDKKVKEARIRGLEKQIAQISQKGLRNLGIKAIRVLSTASGVILLADAGARGYLTFNLDKDAGDIAALEIAGGACKTEELCLETVERIQKGVQFLIESSSSIIE